MRYHVEVTELPSGYYRISGLGPCNWAQVRTWPCSENELDAGMFPEAGEQFRADAEWARSEAADEENHND